jgi:ectoine hydroxylase-related dioxygenase (phytanoyl-CoA dioxygenase family)
MPELAVLLEQQGFCLVPGVADTGLIESLKRTLADADCARSERRGQTYGARNLLALAEVRAVAALPAVIFRLQPILGERFRAVRSIFFDKTAEANWPALWHQDLSLAVRERRELPGWSNWSVKRGIPHVQPPVETLDRMVTMRLHLDDCPVENGALRVIPRSHGKGLLGRDAIQAMAAGTVQTVTAKAGDGLFMRPLIVHGSPPAKVPGRRRVLHLEFAPANLLPPSLAWAEP